MMDEITEEDFRRVIRDVINHAHTGCHWCQQQVLDRYIGKPVTGSTANQLDHAVSDEIERRILSRLTPEELTQLALLHAKVVGKEDEGETQILPQSCGMPSN